LIAKVALFKVELDAISNLLMFTKYCWISILYLPLLSLKAYKILLKL
jgi:hypothetical protein